MLFECTRGTSGPEVDFGIYGSGGLVVSLDISQVAVSTGSVLVITCQEFGILGTVSFCFRN